MKRGYLAWDSNRHGIGVPSLDNEHREIVEQVNRIGAAIETSGDTRILVELMEELVQLAQRHFEYEERLMKEHDFPGLTEHAKQHRELLQRLGRLSESFRRSSPHKLDLVMAFITDWAELHLLEGEKVLGEYLSTRGIH
jgi:hemerythrin